MQKLWLIMVVVSISIPAGMFDDLFPSTHAGDELPLQAVMEDCSDTTELLKVADDLQSICGLIVRVSIPALPSHPTTSPCCVVPPIDSESHFCRPPPSVV